MTNTDVPVILMLLMLFFGPPFWLETFWAHDNSLSDEDIDAAMECAHYGHDAGISYNWDSLQAAIDEVNGN